MSHVYLEYRNMEGFDKRDSFFRRIKQLNKHDFIITNTDGALVYAVDCVTYNYCIPYLLNMNPQSITPAYPPGELANAYLFKDRNFKVVNNNFSITVKDVSSKVSLDLVVDFID